MHTLPTLGGNNGFAAGANNLGLIVGWAENTVHDPTCDPASKQVLQFKPVVWGPSDDDIHVLPLISGDTSGSASGPASSPTGNCTGAPTARLATSGI